MTDRGNKAPGHALALAMSGLLYAHAAGASTGDAAYDGKVTQRLEQKRALVERMLFESPLGRKASIDANGLDPAVYREWDSARRSYEQALTAIGTDHPEQAENALDTALALYRDASTRNRQQNTAVPASMDSLETIGERLRGYQASLERIVREKDPGAELKFDAAWVEAELARAATFAHKGEVGQAAGVLLQAQSELERALVQARSGETLVTRIEFDSPEAALTYEIEKLATNQTLLATLASNSAISEGKRRLLGTYLQQSKAASEKAQALLEAGRLDDAMQEAETANAAQTRALRLFGVN